MEDLQESISPICHLSAMQESRQGDWSDLVIGLKNDLNKPEYADFLQCSGFYNICVNRTLEMINNGSSSHEIYRFIVPFLQYYQKRGKAHMVLPTGETFFIPHAINQLKKAGLYRKKMENSEIVVALGEKQIPILGRGHQESDREEWVVINLNHPDLDEVRAEAGLLKALRNFVDSYKDQFKPKGYVLGGQDYNVAVFLLKVFTT